MEMKTTENSQSIGNLTLDIAALNMNELQFHAAIQRHLRNKGVSKGRQVHMHMFSDARQC